MSFPAQGVELSCCKIECELIKPGEQAAGLSCNSFWLTVPPDAPRKQGVSSLWKLFGWINKLIEGKLKFGGKPGETGRTSPGRKAEPWRAEESWNSSLCVAAPPLRPRKWGACSLWELSLLVLLLLPLLLPPLLLCCRCCWSCRYPCLTSLERRPLHDLEKCG